MRELMVIDLQQRTCPPNGGVPAGALIHQSLSVRCWPVFGWWRSKTAQMVSLPASCCHPADGALRLLWSSLLLTVARLGVMWHIVFLGCDTPPGNVPVARDLLSLDGPCCLAHQRSTAPVLSFLCAARGKIFAQESTWKPVGFGLVGPLSSLCTPFQLCVFPSVVSTSPSLRHRGHPAG